MINLGDVVRHKSFKDVACVVHGVDPDDGGLCVEWINTGFVRSWSLGQYQKLSITDFKDWQICVDYKSVCYRYAVWRNL